MRRGLFVSDTLVSEEARLIFPTVGITQYTQKGHIARATLEATCFQTKAILDAMEKDSGKALSELAVDGGMSNSDLAMQVRQHLLLSKDNQLTVPLIDPIRSYLNPRLPTQDARNHRLRSSHCSRTGGWSMEELYRATRYQPKRRSSIRASDHSRRERKQVRRMGERSENE